MTSGGSDTQAFATDADPVSSVIVPVLNESKAVVEALGAIRQVRGDYELIVVDGGSIDGTPELVSGALGFDPRCQLIFSSAGRGNQLRAGAAIARGRALLFLHIDTRLPDSAIELIGQALERPGVIGGNFRVEFEGGGLVSRIFTHLNSWRRWFGIYYGDSAIWVTREALPAIGGISGGRIMEDYELCRKLERTGQTVCFEEAVVTSARRWRDHGVIKTIIVWTVIQWLYLIGVSADSLSRLYYPEQF